jgi:glycosyltransferase involved in cell wall biosynthesis
MRIGIDIRSTLKGRMTGIGYYTLSLINALAEIDPRNDYYLYSRIGFFTRSKRLPPRPGANFRHRIDRFDAGPGKALRDVAVFHTSSFDLRPPKGARFIVTVHDIIPKVFPEGHTKDAISRLDRQLAGILSLADRIVTDAESTKKDLARFYPAETKDKIRVVYPGVGEEFGMLSGESKNLYKSTLLKYNIQSNYILYIGTLEPRKNIKGLIRSYEALKRRYNINQQLVITGMKGWLYDDIFRLAEETGLSGDIIFTGYVPRQDLKIFYNLADVNVYPSFYEGVGLPVLEAFKCGCPVVTSNVSAMPEFASDAAVLIDPHSVDSITEGIYKILSDKGLRERMRQKGIVRASGFTWQLTARRMLDIFSEAAE